MSLGRGLSTRVRQRRCNDHDARLYDSQHRDRRNRRSARANDRTSNSRRAHRHVAIAQSTRRVIRHDCHGQDQCTRRGACSSHYPGINHVQWHAGHFVVHRFATIITVGGRTTLTWGAVTNASSVEIDQGIGYVIAPGAILVLPTTTTVYTMTAYCGSESVTAQVKITVPYAIVGSVTNANPTESTGACPKTISFSADITVNDAGSVSYKWESSNSTNDSPTQSINFDGPGTKTVTTSWTLGGAGQTINDRWMRIHIFSPTEVTSNNATFTIKCN